MMTANEIRLAFAAWKLLNRKHHLTTARFERLTKEPLGKVCKLVEDAFGVKVEAIKEGDGVLYHMTSTEAKQKAVAAPKKAKPAAKKAAPKKVPAKKSDAKAADAKAAREGAGTIANRKGA